MSSYNEVLKDYKYLYVTIGGADDMTGGYIEGDDVDKLLFRPTKSTAKKIMLDRIDYWFQVGVDPLQSNGGLSFYELIDSFCELESITNNYEPSAYNNDVLSYDENGVIL